MVKIRKVIAAATVSTVMAVGALQAPAMAQAQTPEYVESSITAAQQFIEPLKGSSVIQMGSSLSSLFGDKVLMNLAPVILYPTYVALWETTILSNQMSS